jgi:hypothetical protein
MSGSCKPIQSQGKGLWQSPLAFSISALFAGLLLISASSVSAQSTKKYKIGALTKSLANPYFLLMKQGYEYAQKKLGVDVVFGSTRRKKQTCNSSTSCKAGWTKAVWRVTL